MIAYQLHSIARGIFLVTPAPTIDPATAMCVGGGLCITALLVGSIAMIIVLTGISAAISVWIFRALGKYLKK